MKKTIQPSVKEKSLPPKETVGIFVETIKTDIGFVHSDKWAEPVKSVLPISVFCKSF
ncbi:hypothetical protein HMPREF1987_01195 [Peptostreptococcaceae bacterium oral taxon 113 str. W5053]|nr:hypothetical protein HMPREF1987_01195 [Peptostreptococcaceae bacterium oral taxon 113 str. W5053]